MSEGHHEEDRLEEAPQDELTPASGPLQIESTPDDRNMAFISHLVGGFIGFIVPLIIWLIKKDQSKFVDDQGKEALNFQLTILIGHVVLVPVMCIPVAGLIAIPLHLALRVFSVVFGIIGGMAAQKGEVYRYPIALRMIK
ncbi:MAG TPA: DUF4870 domain-containing protein [Gemmataceae bacterium]|nr:DUF4870 domain-containing protein [Gemmataceae bacterium]